MNGVSALEPRARAAAQRFVAAEGPLGLSPLGDGLINDTFLLQAPAGPRVVLQRLNRAVFPDPPAILHNLRTLENHLQQQPAAVLVLPRLIPTLEGEDYLLDADGDYWRALEYLEGALTLDSLDGPDRAERVGIGLARFHRLFSGLDPARLQDTLPGFHVTYRYLQDFRETIAGLELKRAREVGLCEGFVEDRAERALGLERALHEGRTRLRVVHGLVAPLTLGSTRQAGLEVDKTLQRGPVTRIHGGYAIVSRENPAYDTRDLRNDFRVEGSRQFPAP